METKLKSTMDQKLTILDLGEILKDFKLACESRELSVLMRKEVLTGKAKFGIGGDGKEIPLIAVSKTFNKGDYWSGYYRDQTFMLAKNLLNLQEFFSALYGDSDNDIFSAGRQMNNHFSTPMLDKDGNWKNQKNEFNVTSSISPLGGHLPRALGIGLASNLYKNNEFLKDETIFSNGGQEISFCTIGDASTSEGVFFESINAAGVMQIPIAFIILDDGFGISVPTKYQTTKESISEVLKGFQTDHRATGIDLYTCKAWDYPGLIEMFKLGIEKIRNTKIPAVFHIQECTQPQGHSTSGSHQRYKSKERLDWENEFDGIAKMKQWILDNFDLHENDLNLIQNQAAIDVRNAKNKAWAIYKNPLEKIKSKLLEIYKDLNLRFPHYNFLLKDIQSIQKHINSERSELLSFARTTRFHFANLDIKTPELENWILENQEILSKQYNTNLYNSTDKSTLKVKEIPAVYNENSPTVNGYQILNAFFDQLFRKDPRVYAFGEDVGKIGDVNQALSGLQQKYGEDRIFDTGIREWTIVGQAIGMAMRGLRPIAEIQYIDYLPYAFSGLSDDLATLHYRTNGNQSAPAIIRTRGHRLEGIWHSGSPMAMLLGSMRGINILTPRNMTQAVGMYNTVLQSDDPCIMIECLNGYRIKEKMPSNIGNFTVPLGIPEIILEGSDVTIVSYGSTLSLAKKAALMLHHYKIEAELIDIQTLIPFDIEHKILDSIKKTNRIVFVDEDVPGGATAYMMQEVLEVQKAYFYLDAPPISITAKAHRPAYGNDGDYASKPSTEDIFKAVYNLVKEQEIML